MTAAASFRPPGFWHQGQVTAAAWVRPPGVWHQEARVTAAYSRRAFATGGRVTRTSPHRPAVSDQGVL
jgi:hypothetical protein